jgi:AcrR family transcriptional regulator
MPAVPTTPKGRQTRAHLLESAREVFARDGFVSTRMADVATEAGVSLGALYRYFRNKEDLFEALIADTHEGLFINSRPTRRHFNTDPYGALLEANEGYLSSYYENRHVMRTLAEAAHVDARFQDIWWKMRARHIERFLASLSRVPIDVRLADDELRRGAEAMACMVEQSAYLWYAQEARQDAPVPTGEAAEILTRAWYQLFFGDPPPRER